MRGLYLGFMIHPRKLIIMNNIKEQASDMENEMYYKLGLTPKTLMLITIGLKILMLVFVIIASLGFYDFYIRFEELGCEAYCETKSIGVSGQILSDSLNNLSHSGNCVPTTVYYQNSNQEPSVLPETS